MTADIVLIVVGCGLVIVGLVGGGIKSKWVDVGSIAGLARFLCFAVGIAFVLGGLWVKVGAPLTGSKPNSNSPYGDGKKSILEFSVWDGDAHRYLGDSIVLDRGASFNVRWRANPNLVKGSLMLGVYFTNKNSDTTDPEKYYSIEADGHRQYKCESNALNEKVDHITFSLIDNSATPALGELTVFCLDQ